MRNVSDKSCRENQNKHFVFNKHCPPPPENRAICEVLWKNILELGRPQMTISYGARALRDGYLRLQTHT